MGAAAAAAAPIADVPGPPGRRSRYFFLFFFDFLSFFFLSFAMSAPPRLVNSSLTVSQPEIDVTVNFLLPHGAYDVVMTRTSRLVDRREDLDAALEEFDRAVGAKELLAAARAVRSAIESLEQAAVQQARTEGLSWSKIGSVYGLTKQGAQQRFRERGRKRDDAGPAEVETEPDSLEDPG